MRQSILLLFLAGLFPVLGGCSDNPSNAGYDIIPPVDLVGVRTFDSRAAGSGLRTSSYRVDEPHAQGDLLSLGRSGEYEATALLRFLPLTSIVPDSVTGGIIRSATITLHPAPYALGDMHGTLSFDILKITSSWNSLTFIPRSLDSVTTDPAPKGGFTGIVPDTAALVLPIDTAMVREWFMLYKQGAPSDIRGVLLKPTGASNTIRPFYTFESGSLQPILTVIIERFGKADTLSAFGPIDTYAMTGSAVPATVFEAQGGIIRRGRVVFDVSAVPPNSVINAVTVELTLNRPASQMMYRGTDSLFMQALTDTLTSAMDAYGIYGFRKTAEEVFTFTGTALIRAVQGWVNRPWLNYGFALRAPHEDADPDLYAFHGAGADTLLRPRIVITYTTQPL